MQDGWNETWNEERHGKNSMATFLSATRIRVPKAETVAMAAIHLNHPYKSIHAGDGCHPHGLSDTFTPRAS